MTVQFKQLTYERINRSPEIQSWLNQFGDYRTLAVELLLRLRFVSRDVYSEWLKTTIESVRNEKVALFAVRKFESDVESVWDDQGRFRFRPAASLGSEDLVQSVIANLARNNSDTIYDHPDLATLGEQKVHKFILVDDSIGSGKRVKGYLERLFNSKTVRSWWSFGRFRIVVVAFARAIDSTDTILEGIPGSNHAARVHPKNTKVDFVSHLSYARKNLFQRWGPSFDQILQLCMNVDGVPRNWRRGFRNTMANIVFYHSVPNNLPGALWFPSDEWNALFPLRSLPAWLPQLLDGRSPVAERDEPSAAVEPSADMIQLLRLAKRGIRDERSLAWHLGLDRNVVGELAREIQIIGLLTAQNRITAAGRRFLSNRVPMARPEFDQSIYIPQTWCADREPVQPLEGDH